MKTFDLPPLAIAAAGLGVGLIAYAMIRKPAGQSLAQSVATGAVTAATDAAAGVVVGLGDAVGIPATSADQCGRDMAAGNYWDASFSCPAGTFLSGLFGPTTTATPVNTGGATGGW